MHAQPGVKQLVFICCQYKDHQISRSRHLHLLIHTDCQKSMSASLPSLYGSNESIDHGAAQTTTIPQQLLNDQSHPAPETSLFQHVLPSPVHNQDPVHCPSQLAEDVKNELKQLLKKTDSELFGQLIRLTTSLSECSEEGLLMMDTEGLVEHVLEAVNKDCKMTFGVEINIKNLYIYFYKKKYKELAVQPLICDEVMPQ